MPRFPVPRFLLPRFQPPLNTLQTLHLYAPPEIRQLTFNSLRLWNCAQNAYSQFTLRSQRPSVDHRWSGWPLYSQKNACPASALFQCSLIRSDAADHKATPPPPMKNARRAAAGGHQTTQRRRQPPVRRRTALPRAQPFVKVRARPLVLLSQRHWR